MKVISIGTDRNLLKRGEPGTERILDYGKLAEELHIILFCLKGLDGRDKITLANNVFVYPTSSKNKPSYITDAIKIGRNIIPKNKEEREGWLITTQDPFETGLVGWALHFLSKVPLNVQVHTDFLSKYFAKESFKNWLRVRIGKIVLKRAQSIRVVSERIKDSIIAQIKVDYKKIFVLPVLVDIQKTDEAKAGFDLHQKYPQFDFIVLMACRFAIEKNIPLALRVIKNLTKTNPKIGLVLVGDGAELEKIKSKASELKIEKSVIIEGWVNNLTPYYKTADLFLITSNYEGYGRTMVEAVASGCPVVTTDVGLAGELIADNYNGFVSPIGGKDELAFAIKRLITDASLRSNFINSARHSLGDHLPKEYFNREAYLERYKEIWQKTLEK